METAERPAVLAERAQQLVLVVEDDPHIRAALEAGLAFAGYAVEAAADGGQALQRMEVRKPAVILLDLGLPTMSGAALAEELDRRGLRPEIPIILISAEPDLPDVAARIGADAFFAKPLRLPLLLREVAHLAGA
jgi:CheY-like chemotaxis protein